MKIDRLETHDRLLHLKKDQALNVAQGAEDCLKKNYLSICIQKHSPYVYLFAHPRTGDDGVTKVMYWQPRLTKPTPQTNSYLFRAVSNSDTLEVIWLLPPEEMWAQYQTGNVTENESVLYSIHQYINNLKGLSAPHPDDLSDDLIKSIYINIASEIDQDTLRERLYTTTETTTTN